MIKYCGSYITFQEVPNEVSLTLTITNCPHRCKGCHSPWLQTNIGDDLTQRVLEEMIRGYGDGITCVCFMGEGNDPRALANLILTAHVNGKKACLYSGESAITDIEALNILDVNEWPDYIKLGPYMEDRGGLACPGTNQIMLKCRKGLFENITRLFWKEKT